MSNCEDQWEAISEPLSSWNERIYVYEKWWFHYYKGGFEDFHMYKQRDHAGLMPFIFSFSLFLTRYEVQNDRSENHAAYQDCRINIALSVTYMLQKVYFINQTVMGTSSTSEMWFLYKHTKLIRRQHILPNLFSHFAYISRQKSCCGLCMPPKIQCRSPNSQYDYIWG